MRARWLDGNGDGDVISADALRSEGIPYERVALGDGEWKPRLDALMAERGYVKQDVVALGPDTPNLDALCAKFLDEHHHTEDEVRFTLEGEGVFDIRSRDDRWMRVTVETGDLLVVPANRHHRFFLTEKRTIRCVRLFQTPDGWVAHYRDQVETSALPAK